MNFEERKIEWTGEKVARLWNYYQHTPSISQNFFGQHQGGHVTHLINQKINFAKTKKILDLSCGRGDIIAAALPYLKNGQEIYGTDFSANSVNFVTERFKDVKEFKGASLITEFPAPLPDNEFDLIMSTEVVEHLTDDELDAMFKESYRLLKPGGYLFISTPNDEDLDLNTTMCPDCGCTFNRWQHLRSWSAGSLKFAVERHGFDTVAASPIAWGGTPLKRIIYKMAAKVKMKLETGLVYIGRKK